MKLLQERMGYQFQDEGLLLQALTHKSFHNEHPEASGGDNERFEFLGDAVLDLALSDYLMKIYPQVNEGVLSKVRASLVNEAVLAELAKEFKCQSLLRLGRGETQSGGSDKPRLLASAFEALVGALYLDAGFERSRQFVCQVFESRVKDMDPDKDFQSDYKTRLQELSQEQFKQTPAYQLVGEHGPDHDKTFVIQVAIGERKLAEGQGKSKKQAEQAAAKIALEEI